MTVSFWMTIALVAVLGHAMALIWRLAEGNGSPLCHRKIYRAAAGDGQMAREARNALHAPIHALMLLAFAAGGCFEARSILFFFTSLALVFVWAEIWHYASHRAFHLRALHWIHAEHHRSRISSPLTAISFSFSEKLIFDLGLLGALALLDRVWPLNFYGVAAWFVGYLVINSFSHANFEFRPAGYTAHLGRVLTSTTYHSLHHARYTGNYGLGTRFLDRLFGTEWPDYEDVFHRVTALEQPLGSMHEKVSTKDAR